MDTTDIETTWQAPPQAPLPCTITIRSFSERERWQRAAPAGILLSLAGIGTIAIPIIHFFAPPLLLALAVVLTRHHLKMTESLTRATGTCPGCARPIDADTGSVKPDYPVWISCPHDDCRERIRILSPEPAET